MTGRSREHRAVNCKMFSDLLLIGTSDVTATHRSSVPEEAHHLKINLMDEGERRSGLIYLCWHEIGIRQYVGEIDGCAIPLPSHEVLRQQDRPSLDHPQHVSTGTGLSILQVSDLIYYS